MYQLYIANKNYSSWSLRAWALMRELRLPFQEHVLMFGDEGRWSAYRRIAPAGLVPCLIDGDTAVWDSLAIVEYLAERHAGVWPVHAAARAWARSAAAEMHSGFVELRNRCGMSCGQRIHLHEFNPALLQDIARLETLWAEGLQRFGGPFLAGAQFTAVDAFFVPVAFRAQTYALPLPQPSSQYVARLLGLTSATQWYRAALQERSRHAPHELAFTQAGTITADLRQHA
jgi:glutathione S-transferase